MSYLRGLLYIFGWMRLVNLYNTFSLFLTLKFVMGNKYFNNFVSVRLLYTCMGLHWCSPNETPYLCCTTPPPPPLIPVINWNPFEHKISKFFTFSLSMIKKNDTIPCQFFVMCREICSEMFDMLVKPNRGQLVPSAVPGVP